MPKRRGKIPMARAIETSAISTRPGLSGAADALRREPPLRGKAEIRAQKRRARPAQSAMMKSDLRRLTVSGVTGRLPLWVISGCAGQTAAR
jgi:hypothetical protein